MTREEHHDQRQKSRPPYGGSTLRVSMDPDAPVGTSGHGMEGDAVPLSPLARMLKCNCRQCTFGLDAGHIGHIRARSPEARGRSERAFGTLQGRLPQELRLEGITDYQAANVYLETVFVPSFNRRFTVEPQQPESAFTRLVGLDLDLLLSVQHERRVRADNTVLFERIELQLSSIPERIHFARCSVLVHRFLDGSLGVSFQGRLVGRFSADGRPLATRPRRQAQAARKPLAEGA